VQDIAQPMPVDGPSASGRPPCPRILQRADTDLFGPGKDVDSSMRDRVSVDVPHQPCSQVGVESNEKASLTTKPYKPEDWVLTPTLRRNAAGSTALALVAGAPVCLEVQVRSG
jgi:hypothetical protein